MNSYPQYYELVCKRYSCRSYDPTREVSDELVRAIVETAQLAPSACNRQPWQFVAVRNFERRQRMLAKSRPSFIDAPVLLVACGKHSEAWVRPSDNKDHTDIDLAIAVEHMCLAATSLDLATCWICSFDVEAVRNELSLPDDVEPVALLPIGFAAPGKSIAAKVRKPLDDILKWENL
jgi:nitroreductase